MGLQHQEFVPPSFGRAAEPGFLGSPEVVGELLGRFLSDSEADLLALGAGRIDKGLFERRAKARIRDEAAIFGGHNPEFTTQVGFNETSLAARLQADLGPFYAKRRSAWADNALCVFFEWLLLRLVDAWKRADGDDTLLATILRPDVQAAQQRLLGVAKTA